MSSRAGWRADFVSEDDQDKRDEYRIRQVTKGEANHSEELPEKLESAPEVWFARCVNSTGVQRGLQSGDPGRQGHQGITPPNRLALPIDSAIQRFAVTWHHVSFGG